jgi:hypothetical protein
MKKKQWMMLLETMIKMGLIRPVTTTLNNNSTIQIMTAKFKVEINAVIYDCFNLVFKNIKFIDMCVFALHLLFYCLILR